jgi:hypothetical protein
MAGRAMTEFKEFVLNDAPDQEFTTILAGQRCTFRFRYNVSTDRWSFDLRIGDDQVLYGRKLVSGTDLLGAFRFGIGSILTLSIDGSAPDRTAIPTRRVRVYHAVETA